MNDIKVGKIVKGLSVNIEKFSNNLLKKEDLSISQGIVLIWLNETKEKEMPIKEIERKFGTAQSTIFGLVNRLESKKYVESYSINCKTKIVRLCSEGAQKVPFIKECIQSAEREMFKDFTDGEKLLFTELLKRAENNLKQ